MIFRVVRLDAFENAIILLNDETLRGSVRHSQFFRKMSPARPFLLTAFSPTQSDQYKLAARTPSIKVVEKFPVGSGFPD